ncbi:GNAT family N-acetyltransferase [uncultured Bradyrhizobium sp.]|jgi:GNAT superfamily N-acetyltransferase|uniref:GNAT family N-acetyltransferase n=1 Tax=uncultured Bradyrhizobium sp. TaxID=199684 RepID=UPI00262C7CA2|nr:GNAT family N-acetyltransferase [uncultured Bradyrhizobium sp.]
MEISIADKNSSLKGLVSLFGKSLAPQYISHSELQGYRAVRPGKWAKNIEYVLAKEIGARLKQPRRKLPIGRNWSGVIEAYEGRRLVGLALITMSRSAAVPFGVIEDIVIDKKLRDGGRGELIMDWIKSQMLAAGIKRLFLESGIQNDRAHHLFERMGFRPVSVVMMQDLRKT